MNYKRIASALILGFLTLTSFHPSQVFAAEGENTPLATREIQPVVKVFIKQIIVDGNSLLPDSVLRAVLAPFENKELSFEDAKNVAMALTNEYRKRGYFLAQAYVPYQRITKGVLQINVIEGKLGKVVVRGNKHYSTKYILYSFRPATEHNTLRYDSLEKYIMLLNENTDLHVAAVLQPGEAPGTTDVVLNVTDSAPSHLDGDFNNFGTITGGQHQPSLTYSAGNLITEGSNFTVTPLFPYPNKSTDLTHPIVSANYSMPINNLGTKMTASYSSADVRLGAELDVLNVVGNTNIVGVGMSQALSRSDSHSSNMTATFYSKSSHNFVLNTQTSRDVLREIAVGYNINWVSGSGSNLYDATFTKGLGTLFGGETNYDPLSSNPGTGDDFSKMNMDIYRFQSLGSGILMILKGSGQYAFNALVSPEQYLAGGSESIRGYRPAEIVGDSGWNGTLEFRIPVFTRPKSNLQFEIFSDMGSEYTRLVSPGTLNSKSLWGGGFGFRMNSGDNTAIRLELGFPLTPVVNSTNEKPVLYADFSTRFL